MKWEGQRQSDNVDDQRDGGGGPSGGGGGLRLGGGKLGLGSVVIALLASWAFGLNPLTVLSLLSGGGGGVGGGGAPVVQSSGAAQAPAPHRAAQDPQTQFVKTVLADTEDVWRAQFVAGNRTYEDPVLVLFRGSTRTACGRGEAAMGPFYCPGDHKVYIDLGFFDTLRQRLGAPGDFAQAYVIAHEVGHHVQNLLGISAKVDAQRGKLSEVQMNALSVRLELQADCLAGVWAYHSQQGKGWLEQGDLEEALNAASQIGDDTLQRNASGTVRPESFTHGSSAQRVAWFKRGWQSGRTAQCDTFAGRPPA